MSWKPQQGALCIDAFTISWSKIFFYAFPPFAMILKALSKIKKEGAEGIIVVPFWKNQAWFPLFKSLIIGETIIFEPNDHMLLSSCRTKTHPHARKLRLIAARVSGRLF